jgi:hypothetical protein|tara:strand:+ start:3712 stop:4065 length:354 start_codon:yes stop_codon:yes gene_type:complete
LKTHLIYSLSKREKSRPKRTAATNPQFATGPQKCVVFGPVGEFTHRANAEEDINLYFFYSEIYAVVAEVWKGGVSSQKKILLFLLSGYTLESICLFLLFLFLLLFLLLLETTKKEKN